MPSSSVCGVRGVERVPAHVRDFQRRIGRRDLVDLAADPAEPVGHHIFAAALGHELHADADAEERPALAAHRLLQRLDHARHRIEPAPAIGEGADARQHDAVGARAPRPDRASPRSADRARSRARRARSLRRRMQIARTVIDDGDAHARGGESWPRLRLGKQADDVGRRLAASARLAAAQRPAAAIAASRRDPASKKRRSAVSRSCADHEADVGPAAAQAPAPQRRGFEADQNGDQRVPTANFTAPDDAERPAARPAIAADADQIDHEHQPQPVPATSTAAPSRNAQK